MHLGAEKEYLKGELEKIGCHLRLGRGETAGTNGRKMEDGRRKCRALAALMFLVEGGFWELSVPGASMESEQASKYYGVP